MLFRHETGVTCGLGCVRTGYRIPMQLNLRRGMPTVELVMSVAPESAWAVITDLAAWPEWGPTVSGAELDSDGKLAMHSTGKVLTPIGVSLPFRITEFVDGRRWEWAVAGVQATSHEVLPHEVGCTVSFGVPFWAPAYLPIMAIALPRIQRLAKAMERERPM